MGGRGGSSASAKRGSVQGGAGISLNDKLVSRANDMSVLADTGNRINRKFERNVAEINSMSLSDSEKTAAISEQKALAEAALKVHTENPSGFVTGRARLNAAKAHTGADKASRAEYALETHMKGLRKQSEQARASVKQQSRAEIIQKALRQGDMSVVIDGVTYARKTKRSRSFTRVD